MKQVSVTVDLLFMVPDDTDDFNLTVKFPQDPVVCASLNSPIEPSSFEGHTSESSMVCEDDD